MKKMRILALVLATLMVLVLFAGCGKEEPTDTSVTTTTSETTTTETTTESTTTALNFGGYNFSLVSGFNGLYYENPADANQQAIMDIVRDLESTYNFKITNRDQNDSDMLNTELMAATLAGNKYADFFFSEAGGGWGSGVSGGYLRRLDTDEVRATGMDVLNPNQFNYMVAQAETIDGGLYGTRINSEKFPDSCGYFLAFNKALCAGAGYPADTIYQAVRDYTWTWDVLIDICHAGAVYNAETQLYDVGGIGLFPRNPFLASANSLFIQYVDGKYVSALTSINFISAMNMWTTRLQGDPAVVAVIAGGNSAHRRAFYAGQTIFCGFDGVTDPYGNTAFSYGVVPYPRTGTATEYTSLILYHSIMSTQMVNQDWQTSCAILGLLGTALNAPDCGISANAQYFSDAESMEMFSTYIYPNTLLDLYELNYGGQIPAAWSDFSANLGAGMTVMAAAEAANPAMQAAIDSFFKLYNK